MTEITTLAGGELLLAVEPEDVTAGGAGFVVIAALAVGTVFLLRSLNKQLKKVDFEEEPAESTPADGRAVDGSADEGRPGEDGSGENETAENETGENSADRESR